MKYFAIAGKNEKLSLLELQSVAKNIETFGPIFVFDTNDFEKCRYLAGFTKVGHFITEEEFKNLDKKLVGSNKRFETKDKQKYNIKRYKHLELVKTDLEVKTKWIEAIFIKEFPDLVWIVDYYQNISLYETIDFEKPVSSMDIWMMPAKLTHLLVNLSTTLNYNKTIYDPFVGLWTTAMIWNYLWNNIIASDLNPSPCRQNWKFWQTTKFYNPDFKFILFKHDITKSFKNKVVNYTTNVVSEWFLWPKVWKYLNEKEASNLEKSFQNVYIEGIKNLYNLPNLENITITFPAYKLYNKKFYLFEDTFDKLKKAGINLEIVDEIYYRKWQKVGRNIVLIRK